MAKTNIGRVSIVPAGEYSSLIEYKRLTAVSYQGNMYISRTDCLGIEPTNEDYWFKATSKGDKGETGATGPAGKDFSIYKTYPSISAMEADINNVPEGSFVMIASDVEDEDNSKLYVKSETSFVYITDMSGATGMKGDKGDKGDKPVKGVDYFTQEDIDSMVSEITDDANSVFNQNVTSKTNDFNTNASEKTSDFNDNYTEKLNSINNASTTAVSNVKTAEDTAISNIETAEESAISDINTAKTNAIEEINSTDNVERITDLETGVKTLINIKDILLENFDTEEAEGTEIDIESTAEAPIEILKIEGNTIQNGEPSLDNEVEVEGVSEKINFSDNIAEKELENQYRNNAQSGSIVQTNGFDSYIATIKPNSTYLIKNGHSNICLFDANMQYITGYSVFQETVNTDGINNVAFITIAVEQIKESDFSIIEEIRENNNISIRNKNQLILEDVAAEEASSIVEGKEQIHTISLGNKVLYGDENARDYFNITIDQDFYQKTGYRKITSLDLVRNWKKYEVTGNEDIRFASNSTNIFVIINAITGNSLTSNDGYCSHFKVWKDYVESSPGWANLEDGYCIVGRTTYHQILCKSLQFDNDLEGFKSKLQALKSAGTPMYVLFILEIPETENITDQTLISEIENFINNSYTYKQATSINSDFYLKLNYKKNMYYDLESRISALEQASTTSNTQE